MITWTPNLSVDIKEIDEQHQLFIKLMADIQRAIETKAGREVVGPILMELYGYAHFHFSVEEKYFALFNFSGAVKHVAEHRQFVERLTDLRRRNEQGNEIAGEVGAFMFEWLVNHIENMDRQYVQCFHDHGLR